MKINTKYIFLSLLLLVYFVTNLKNNSNNNSNEIENKELNAEKLNSPIYKMIYIGDYLTQDEACNVKITIEKNKHIITS